MSGRKRELVAYVHDLSPIKKARTANTKYYKMKLQTENEVRDAVCYSTAKRQLLEISQQSLSPNKLLNFAESKVQTLE